MKTILFVACGVALLVTATTAVTQGFAHSNQSSFVKADGSSDMSNYTQISQTSQQSTTSNSDSSGYQHNFTSSQTTSSSSGYQDNFTSSQTTSSSSGYQHDSLDLDAASLKKPHILSINSSGRLLIGQITINGKVVKRIRSSKEKINLSPLLSVGKQTVDISARYAPASASVSVELSGPDTKVTEQTSGDGVLKYSMTVNVQ
jgi:uncharacterized protein YxeA